jgi:D-alanyl-D-alanine dipeptidase
VTAGLKSSVTPAHNTGATVAVTLRDSDFHLLLKDTPVCVGSGFTEINNVAPAS